MQIEDVWDSLGRKTKEFILSDDSNLIYRTFTGSGKTTKTMMTIADSQAKWIYVAPFHDIVEENIRDSPFRVYNFLHLKSRSKECLKPKIQELAKSGIDISGFCEDCGYRKVEACKYEPNVKKAYNERPNLCLVHAHLNSWIKNFLSTETKDGYISDEYDYLIIDENPATQFMSDFNANIRDISYFRECCVRIGMPKEIMEFLDLVMSNPIDYDLFEEIEINKLDEYNTKQFFSERMADLYLEDPHVNKIPPNMLDQIFGILKCDSNRYSDMIWWNDDRDVLSLMYFIPDLLDIPIKIIGLDGTANNKLWSNMLGYRANVFRIDNHYKNVYQLNGGEYPITTWKKSKDSRKRICNMIAKIASCKERDVLVIGTKYVCWKIRQYFRENDGGDKLKYGIYYNLRSRNEFYKMADTVILACSPNIPPRKLQTYVNLSGWPLEMWWKVFREEEMRQAIGRIRANIDEINGIVREDREIYILPSIGVNVITSELVPEAKVISYNALWDMLEGSRCFDEDFSLKNKIINACPTSVNDFKKQEHIGHYKAKSYFIELLKDGSLTYNRGKYRATNRGKETVIRGIVEKGIVSENRGEDGETSQEINAAESN